jgi:UDPglucose 6-dehydrogenase
MNVTIVGTGYVGLVTGACLAELGNNVFCLDADAAKVALLEGGGMPIYEPGLQEIVQKNHHKGRLMFSTDAAAAVAHGDVLFIAVGTPPQEDGSADLQHVRAVARTIGRHMEGFKVIVQKSTVPVGTAQQMTQIVREELALRGLEDEGFSVVSNPEFLKEGAAVADFMSPDRIVLGVDDDEAGQAALRVMRKLYRHFDRPHERVCVMDVASAELTKYAANAMLATRISFMNELANLAEQVGADIELVRRGIGSDGRIGPSFLSAGTGYGGSCFPKDVEALCRTAQQHGRDLRVLQAVQAANRAQKQVLLQKVFARYGSDLHGQEFAILGLAFKPETDDMREAPSREIVAGLLRAGASLRLHDPVAEEQARKALADDLAGEPQLLRRVRHVRTPMEALDGADGMLLVTEWKAYRALDAEAVRKAMRTPLVFDGRNLFDLQAFAEAGVACIGIGRSNLALLRPAVAAAPQPASRRREASVRGGAGALRPARAGVPLAT